MAYLGLLLAVTLGHASRLLVAEGAGLGAALPDLPLMTALFIGFRARNTGQLGLAIVLGLLADCFSSRPLGHFAFLYGAAAYLALRVRRYVPPDVYLSLAVASLFCTLVTAGLAFLIALVTVDGPLGPGFTRSLLTALTSASAAPFVFTIWQKSRFFRRALDGRRYEFA